MRDIVCPSGRQPEYDRDTKRQVCYTNPFIEPQRLGPYKVPCCPRTYIGTSDELYEVVANATHVSALGDKSHPGAAPPQDVFDLPPRVTVGHGPLYLDWDATNQRISFSNHPMVGSLDATREQVVHFLDWMWQNGLLRVLFVTYPPNPASLPKFLPANDRTGPTNTITYHLETATERSGPLRIEPKPQLKTLMNDLIWSIAQLKSQISDTDIIDMLSRDPRSSRLSAQNLQDLAKYAEQMGRTSVAKFIRTTLERQML